MNQIIQENLDYKLNVGFLGESGTGKTILIQRMIESDNPFNVQQTTIGIDIHKTMILQNGKKIQLNLQDTSGQERYRNAIGKQYYNNSDGIFFVYENEETFNKMSGYWMIEAQDKCPYNTVFCILANKSDKESLNQEIIEQGRNLASEKEFLFYITSSITNEGVLEARNKMVEKIIENYIPKQTSKILKPQKNQEQQEKKVHKGCC